MLMGNYNVMVENVLWEVMKIGKHFYDFLLICFMNILCSSNNKGMSWRVELIKIFN